MLKPPATQLNQNPVIIKCLALLLLITVTIYNSPADAKKCLYINSYHPGYEWSDRLANGLRRELKGRCELKQYHMDTKRNTSERYKKQAGLTARKLILDWKPDVVIASDDNASKYVIKPYFKNHSIPFVFCGINWTVDAYGYPYRNATGMVEVAPIKELFNKVENIIGKPASVFYLGVNVLTERKNLARFKIEARKRKIKLTSGLAKTSSEWLKYYQQAQNYDFVVIGGNAGLQDWDYSYMSSQIKKLTKKLSVTIQGWMVSYAIFGLTKIPEEQGEWAARVALYILDGANPGDIPIVSNRKWDIWVNERLLKRTDIVIPHSIIRKAKKVQ